MKIEVLYKHKTGKVKQGYNQLGSVFGVNGISPTLDSTRKKFAIKKNPPVVKGKDKPLTTSG